MLAMSDQWFITSAFNAV